MSSVPSVVSWSATGNRKCIYNPSQRNNTQEIPLIESSMLVQSGGRSAMMLAPKIILESDKEK